MKFNGASGECLVKAAPRRRGAQRLACKQKRQARFSRQADKRSSPANDAERAAVFQPAPTTLRHSRTARTQRAALAENK
jgi:hypothetical protein